MSQSDMNLTNQAGAAFRAALNAALQALASGSSGTSRPATCYAGQVWIDTDYDTNIWGVYRIVDPANSALDTLIELIDTTTGLRTPVASGKAFDHINIVRRGNAGGTVDAITATLSPTLSALVDGAIAFIEAAGANTSTTPTFAPDGLTAKTIKKLGNQALAAGDIYGAGHVLVLRYDAGNGVWELMNPAVGNVATAAEAQAFTAGRLIDGAMLAAALQGGNQSLAASGFQKLPGGLIIQWGTYAGGANNPTITLPVTYPNANLTTICGSTGNGSLLVFLTNSIGVSSFKCDQRASSTGATSTGGFTWLSIGY